MPAGLHTDNGSVRLFADMVRGDASLFGANRTKAQLVRCGQCPRFSELKRTSSHGHDDAFNPLSMSEQGKFTCTDDFDT